LLLGCHAVLQWNGASPKARPINPFDQEAALA
jgi:hypothetical protein